MKKFIFTILNENWTLHKSILLASNLSDAYKLWFEQYGSTNFRGNLNIKTILI